MCLAVPGKVLSIDSSDGKMPSGVVSFGGVNREVCFGYVPEVKVGDYVIVHVGFALSILDEEEARRNLDLIREIEAAIPQSATGIDKNQ